MTNKSFTCPGPGPNPLSFSSKLQKNEKPRVTLPTIRCATTPKRTLAKRTKRNKHLELRWVADVDPKSNFTKQPKKKKKKKKKNQNIGKVSTTERPYRGPKKLQGHLLVSSCRSDSRSDEMR